MDKNRKFNGTRLIAILANTFWMMVISASVMKPLQAQEVEGKQRILVLTDITPKDREPDDYQSMIRLLVHSNMFEIEGIISTTSCWLREGLYTEILYDLIDKYSLVRENLLKHESGFPEPDYLKSIVREGNDGYGMEDVSMEEESMGFRHIIEVVDRPDPRPVWVLVWGGANTLAQAVYYLENIRGRQTTERFLKKVRIYEIQGQDDAGPWICHRYPDTFWLRCHMMNKGMSRRMDRDLFPEAYGGNEEVVSPAWWEKNIMNNHGVLGDDYPMAKYKFEGDSPSLFYLMPVGLNDPEQPWQGSWGGRFQKEKTNKVSGAVAKKEMNQKSMSLCNPYFMYAPGGDTWDYPGGINTPYVDNIFASLFRWRESFQAEFAARMDWCTREYNAANHPPVVTLIGDSKRSAVSGEEVILNATAFDPDGDKLDFIWFMYPEAGTYRRELKFPNYGDSQLKLIAPEVEGLAEIHIILQVTDCGDPALTRYKRVILEVRPK